MKASISNYRGVSAATLEIEAITLVSGPNGSGKSSTCQAVGAALTGEPMPIDDENGSKLAKAKAGVLVRSGTAAGKVELSGVTGTTEVNWPSAKVKVVGQAPAASEFAVGLNSIVTMDIKKRIPVMIDYLKAQPTKENLAAAIGTLIPSGTVDKLWELIQTQGWDATYSQVKEKGAKYKGQWEDVTNANYGIKLATSWLPNGYEPNLEGSSEDTLKACVTDARDSLEAEIAASAVDDSKRQDLEAVAGKLAERQTALDEAKKPLMADADLKAKGIDLQEAKTRLITAQAALTALDNSALKKGDPPKELFCSCGKKLMLDVAGNLCEYTTGGPTQEELDAHGVKLGNQKRAIIAAEQAVAGIQTEHTRLTQARQIVVNAWNQGIADATRLVRESTEAAADLAGMTAPSPAVAVASVDQCRNDLAAHELRLQAFTAKRKADSLHSTIEINQVLLKHVAPTGLRADVLTHAIGNLNTVLAGLSDVAGWPATQITPEFGWSFNGTPYFLCSSAEQFRVRTIVQVAMAMREHVGMIVVDGADILDKGGRNGLFRLLKSAGIPALVGMTINVEAEVPNLAKAGYGRSYWLETGGVAREVV